MLHYRFWVCLLGMLLVASCVHATDQIEFQARARLMIARLGDEEVGGGQVIGQASPREDKSAAKAMLLSAILPGLGQIYAGGRRGIVSGAAMATADIFSMWRYLVNDGRGDDTRREYEAWAASHYSVERFKHYVRDTVVVKSGYKKFGRCTNGSHYDSSACWDSIAVVFPLAEERSGAFYDQIGMDEMFVFGWDDWDPYEIDSHEDLWTDWTPAKGLPDGLPSSSPNRDHYNHLRSRADDFYARADRYAWIMVIGRVVSMIDAAILVKIKNQEMAGWGGNPHLVFCPTFGSNPGFKVSLKMRF